jgi:hypothetical protein
MSIVTESAASPICEICEKATHHIQWNFDLDCDVCDECLVHAQKAVELVTLVDTTDDDNNNKPPPK